MSSRYDYVARILNELGDEMGMSSLRFDTTDRISLYFDDIHLTLAYGAEPVELLWIYVDLGNDIGDDPNLLQRVLQLGFETWTRSVMTIGLDDKKDQLIGYTSIPVTILDLNVLQETLSLVLQSARVVRVITSSKQLEVSCDSTQDDSSERRANENWSVV
ncbi:CesT family type III secretion system chaperone [Thalassoglobus sp. JC818]|uniref:CesT family type III secretion system chaperone n=1 Tax=Thalassoglobus sp. JC818 TaxID=3232136 RepID=UPI00345ACDE9